MAKEASICGVKITPREMEIGHPGKNKAKRLFRMFADELELSRGTYVIMNTGVALEEALSRLLRGLATKKDIKFLEKGYGLTEDWQTIQILFRKKGCTFDRMRLNSHLEFIRSCNQALRE